MIHISLPGVVFFYSHPVYQYLHDILAILLRTALLRFSQRNVLQLAHLQMFLHQYLPCSAARIPSSVTDLLRLIHAVECDQNYLVC